MITVIVKKNLQGKVHLQGVGNKPAKKVCELKVGDVIAWNWGYTSTVVDLIPNKSRKSIKCMLKDADGIVRDRMMRSETLVAIA